MFSRASGTGSESWAMRTFSHSTSSASQVRGTGSRWPASRPGDAVSGPPGPDEGDVLRHQRCAQQRGTRGQAGEAVRVGPVRPAQAQRDAVRDDGDPAFP
ncbi:hypothetical protein GCM10020227_65750 [Streptomyces flavovirens]